MVFVDPKFFLRTKFICLICLCQKRESKVLTAELNLETEHHL